MAPGSPYLVTRTPPALPRQEPESRSTRSENGHYVIYALAEGRDTADYWLRIGMLLGFSFAVWWFLV